MKSKIQRLLRYVSDASTRLSHPPNRVEAALRRARRAWFNAMAPHKNAFGVIQLPHPAPMLTEREVDGCRLVHDRNAILRKIRQAGVVGEVGVQSGEFSRTILDLCAPSRLHLVDYDLAKYRIAEKFATEIDAGIVRLHQGDSSPTLATFPDGYFDLLYIDADHAYPGVKRDIRAGESKVKEDGLLVFNDYTYWSPAECTPYGVIQAVNELCLEGRWQMVYFAFGYYMYCDAALRRRRDQVDAGREGDGSAKPQ